MCSIQWNVRRVFNPVGCEEVCSIQWDVRRVFNPVGCEEGVQSSGM